MMVEKALTEHSLLAVFGTMNGMQVLVSRPDDGGESTYFALFVGSLWNYDWYAGIGLQSR